MGKGRPTFKLKPGSPITRNELNNWIHWSSLKFSRQWQSKLIKTWWTSVLWKGLISSLKKIWTSLREMRWEAIKISSFTCFWPKRAKIAHKFLPLLKNNSLSAFLSVDYATQTISLKLDWRVAVGFKRKSSRMFWTATKKRVNCGGLRPDQKAGRPLNNRRVKNSYNNRLGSHSSPPLLTSILSWGQTIYPRLVPNLRSSKGPRLLLTAKLNNRPQLQT